MAYSILRQERVQKFRGNFAENFAENDPFPKDPPSELPTEGVSRGLRPPFACTLLQTLGWTTNEGVLRKTA